MQPIIFTDHFFLDNHRSAATAVTHAPHFMSTEPILMVSVIIAAQATRVFKLRFCGSQAVSSGFLSVLAQK
jgi:hypothetical protein